MSAWETNAFIGFAFALIAVVLGYAALGPLPSLLFSFGFVGGFFAWLASTNRPAFAVWRTPFYLTLALFVGHKIEEREFGFFPALAHLTGVPPPVEGSSIAIALYSVAATWLLIPWLVNRKIELGYLLAATFFVSMGVTEAAHFVFPFLREPISYFPGVVSAALLVPAAWWGIGRLFGLAGKR